MRSISTRLAIASLLLCGVANAQAQTRALNLAGGKLVLQVPNAWAEKRPGSTMIEGELAIPAVAPDTTEGRLTVMSAGGGAQANIDRWIGQFTQPDGSSTRDRTKIQKTNIAGQEVYLVDVSGTYKDQAGPMAPAVDRPKYRMLAAIILTGPMGDYFIKLYGPQRTIAESEKAFTAMMQGLQKK